MRSKNKELMTKMLNFIDSEYQKNGLAPTLREIASEFNITSACVSHYVTEMKEKGLIQSNGKSRGIKTSKIQSMINEVSYLPVVGSIACGTPLLAEENIEKYLPIPTEFLGNGKYFILKASGNSMINAGIFDGDIVIVERKNVARNGEIVVAMTDENEVTLKTFYKEANYFRLQPENDTMDPIILNNVTILGKAIGLYRKL